MPKNGIVVSSSNGREKKNGLVGRTSAPQQEHSNGGSVPPGEKQTDWDSSREFIWNEDEPARKKYIALGKRLARFGVLYRCPRYGSGMLLLLPGGKYVTITKGSELLPIIVDRLDITVIKNGNISGSTIGTVHLNAMLRSESFLDEFITLDRISSVPVHLPDFSITRPGFNDGGPEQRFAYIGEPPVISRVAVHSVAKVAEKSKNKLNSFHVACLL